MVGVWLVVEVICELEVWGENFKRVDTGCCSLESRCYELACFSELLYGTRCWIMELIVGILCMRHCVCRDPYCNFRSSDVCYG